MADIEIQGLELQIKGNASGATKSLNALIKTLEKLEKVAAGGAGLSSVNKEMTKLKNTNIGLSASNNASARSFAKLATSAGATVLALKKIGKTVASWIDESNEYVENLNLFNVAMGQYAESAMEYANQVSDVMGIDTSDWIRAQGVFMTLATGFGVAGDRASVMSQQLTQLGYDISSFYNISVEDAMTRLQSGISGELEPLRRLGYDLSQAKLEAIALSLGIDKAVSSMTQAEKAELRYYAIMTQVTQAQGDMARTLDAPANQLRIFKSQVSMAARALGGIFIPALNAILPYGIAFIKIIREMATSIASLFGFSLPEVDYSGLDGVGDSASDSSDAVDGVTDAVKKLKQSLLGIDELNVIGDTSANDSLGILGGGFDFELPEYTFLDEIEDKVGGIHEQLKKILKPIGDILKALYEYKEVVIAGLGVLAIIKLWKTISKYWAMFKALKLVDAFITGFQLIKVTGGNVFQSLRGGIDNVRMNLTGLQKAAIVAIAGFAEFSAVRNNIKELAMGCENAGAKIAEMGVIAGVAAGAMYVALGPAGLAVAAVVGITGAVWGFTEAQNEMRKAVVDAAFFDGVGVSLDVYKTKLELVTDAYRVQNEQIGEWGEKIKTNNETIDNASLRIETLVSTLGSTGEITQVEIDEIKGQFDSLYECIRDNLTLSEQAILTALVGAMKRATPEIAAQIDLLIGEYQRFIRDTQGRAGELEMLISNGFDKLVGLSKDDPAYQQIMTDIQGWYTELGYLSGSMSDAAWQWKEMVDNFNVNEVNFGNYDTHLNEISAAGKAALDDLGAARDALLKQIDADIRYASEYGTLEEVEMLGNVRQAIVDDYAAQEAAIKSEINSIFSDIQEAMILAVSDSKAALEAKWEDMNWLERWWYDHNEEKYVRKGLEDLKGHVDTISSTIQGHMNDLETNGSTWASDAMQGIIDALFESKVTRNDLTGSTTRYSYAMDLEDAIEQVFSDLEDSGKKAATNTGNAMTDGLRVGILKPMPDILEDIAGIVSEADQAVRDAAGISSPSKLFATDGGYMMDGLIKGINDKKSSVKSTMNGVVNSAFDTDSAWDSGYDYGESFGKGLVKAIKNIHFPTIEGEVSISGTSASISFGAYAGGGFPAEGQMFVAREAGPELVGTIGNRSAVANNDQIVSAVSQGVAQAVAQVMGQSGNQTVEAKVNDKVLFEVVLNRSRQETIRKGYNPLLGGV